MPVGKDKDSPFVLGNIPPGFGPHRLPAFTDRKSGVILDEPSSPERKAKGDLGEAEIQDMPSRPLSGGGSPWKNLTNGKGR